MSDDRVGDTRILLRSLLDYVPGPRTWTGQLQQAAATRGPAASGRKPCETCGTRGRVFVTKGVARACPFCQPQRGGIASVSPRRDHGCRYCPTCAGAGWVKARGSEFDEYTGAAVDAEHRSTVSGERFLNRSIDRLTASIEHLEELEAIRAGTSGGEKYGWEKHKEAMWRRGSYAELSVILARLRERAPNRYRLVWLAEILGYADDRDGLITLGESLRRQLDLTVVAISRQMPEQIRIPAELRPEQQARVQKSSLAHGRTNGHELQRGERNAQIRALAAEGQTPGQIAPKMALTRRRVQQILAVASGVA